MADSVCSSVPVSTIYETRTIASRVPVTETSLVPAVSEVVRPLRTCDLPFESCVPLTATSVLPPCT